MRAPAAFAPSLFLPELAATLAFLTGAMGVLGSEVPPLGPTLGSEAEANKEPNGGRLAHSASGVSASPKGALLWNASQKLLGTVTERGLCLEFNQVRVVRRDC